MHGPGRVGGFGRGLFGFGAPGNLLYGQATIQTSKGVQTFAYQIGKASGVTSSSITVTSSNGHMQQYTVTPSTIVPRQVGGHHGGGFGRPGDCHRHGVRLHLHGRQRRRHLAGAAGPVGLGLRPGREAWGEACGEPSLHAQGRSLRRGFLGGGPPGSARLGPRPPQQPAPPALPAQFGPGLLELRPQLGSPGLTDLPLQLRFEMLDTLPQPAATVDHTSHAAQGRSLAGACGEAPASFPLLDVLSRWSSYARAGTGTGGGGPT